MHKQVLGSEYKLIGYEYEPEIWQEMINYTATVLNDNPTGISLDDTDYIELSDTSQLYTPLPKLNPEFKGKYKQTLNGDRTVTVSIIGNIVNIATGYPTLIQFGCNFETGDNANDEKYKALLQIDNIVTKYVTTGSCMFRYCINLEYINTKNFDTSNSNIWRLYDSTSS